jgi:hypothetical protein
MKALRIVFTLFLIVTFLSCSKDDVDPDGNLQGRWNVEKVEGQQFTNGNPGIKLEDNNPTGYIVFESNGEGEQNYTFTLFGTAYPNINNFRYSATQTEIIIERFGQADLVWNRELNSANRQIASYDILVNANSFIRYTLTLEK